MILLERNSRLSIPSDTTDSDTTDSQTDFWHHSSMPAERNR
jgi:hypothetical protein